MDLLLRHEVERGSVVDLASGSGTLLVRLSELGFEDLKGVAREPGTFGESDETESELERDFLHLDLNASFSSQMERRFDLVVTSETIEHLRSPRHFLEQISTLLNEGGYLLLTTPNVANWIGRLRFLLFGELRWFDPHLARALGHISPVTDTQMRMMLPECDLELVDATSAGSHSGPLRMLATAALALPFVLVFGRKGWGESNIYLAKKVGRSPGPI